MSHQVLARKCRPKSFQTLVGQEHVLQALINALDKQRLHHAYLFTGTRGVGKTTIARILAKCVNCETGITSTPCGECSTCKEIDAGRFIDLIEVDAASRTKVEDTRELLDNVQYAPTRGRYKIYLIDEVHMLSGHSFNALLKTLEEPPPHVLFLLATTDPQKLPVTVLSRCLQFNLKNLSAERIANYLKEVLAKESIPYEESALTLLSEAAKGSMRDALSLLDQAIAYTHSNIQLDAMREMLGTIDQKYIEALLNSLAERNTKQLLQISHEIAELGVDFGHVLEELLAALHAINIAQLVPDTITHPLANKITSEDVQLYYQIGLLGRRDLNIIQNSKQGFEMTLLRMVAFRPFEATVSDTKPAPVAVAQQARLTTITPSPTALNWEAVVQELPLSSMAKTVALNCALKSATIDKIELLLAPKHAALLNQKTEQRINEALNQYLKRSIQLAITIDNSPLESPAAKSERIANDKHQAAMESLQNDPAVQAMIEQMGANLDPSLVKIQD